MNVTLDDAHCTDDFFHLDKVHVAPLAGAACGVVECKAGLGVQLGYVPVMATEKVVDVEHLLGQRCVLGGVQRWNALEHRGVVWPPQH